MYSPICWEKENLLISERLYRGPSRYLLNLSLKQLSRYGNTNHLSGGRVLEIGTGRGECVKFITSHYDEYLATDVSSWGKSSVLELGKTDERIKFQLEDVQQLSFPDNTFDRIVVSCVLAHVDEPFKALVELRRVLKPKGILSIFVSADPSILLRIMRKFLVEPKMKDLSLPLSLVNAISHRNSAPSVISMAKYIYSKDLVSFGYYPLLLPFWNLATHVIINVVKAQN